MPLLKRGPKRYSRYFGVVAAILIFASWALNTALVERAKSAEGLAAAVASERELYKRFSEVLMYLRNIEKTLASAGRMSVPSSFAQDPVKRDLFLAIEQHRASQVFSSDVADLHHYAVEIGNLAERLDAPAALRRRVHAEADAAQKLAQAYWRAGEDYERELRQIDPDAQVGFSETPEQMRAIAAAMTGYTHKVRELMRGYLQHQNNLQARSYDLERYAATLSMRASIASKRAGMAVLVTFIFGSLLAIAGKWLELSGTGDAGEQATF